MTITDTYNYLSRIRQQEWTILRLTLQHDELQSCLLPSGIRYDKDVVQTSPEDKLSAIAGAVIELEGRIQQLKHQKARLIMEVTAAIDQLPDDKESAVLTAYYVKRMTMEGVAEAIGNSTQHAYRIRKRAVSHLTAILNGNK